MVSGERRVAYMRGFGSFDVILKQKLKILDFVTNLLYLLFKQICSESFVFCLE